MRRFSIDGKFGVNELGQLIKVSNGEVIPDDEPLFLIRGRDRLAIPILEIYGQVSKVDGCNQWHFDKLKTTIEAFERFKAEHPERMKQPSVTVGK